MYSHFIRPSSDGTYYGMVMSVRPPIFCTFLIQCFDIMSWNFAHDFVLMYYRSSLSVITLRQFLYARRDVLWYGDVRPSVRPSGSPYARFPHFSPTCFDILSWNFAYDFVLLYYRSSSSVVNFRQFLWELCPFWNLNYWKYTVFRTFLLHALTYWAEILHMTLFYCTTDQVRVSSICVNFCGSYAPFGTWKYTVFCTFLLHALTYWAEISHMTLFYCTTDQVRVSLISVNFCGSYAPFGT